MAGETEALTIPVTLDTSNAKRQAQVLAEEVKQSLRNVTIGTGLGGAASVTGGLRDVGGAVQQAGGYGIEKLTSAIKEAFPGIGTVIAAALQTGLKDVVAQLAEPATRAAGRVSGVAQAAARAGVPLDQELVELGVRRALAQEFAAQRAERQVNQATAVALGEAGLRAMFGGVGR